MKVQTQHCEEYMKISFKIICCLACCSLTNFFFFFLGGGGGGALTKDTKEVMSDPVKLIHVH